MIESNIRLMVDSHHGVYIPQIFAEGFDARSWGIEEFDPDYQTLLEGPDAEYYWESWEAIMSKAVNTDADGKKFYLHQNDGDLFAVAWEHLNEQEQEQLEYFVYS